jgi:hypothetical protein
MIAVPPRALRDREGAAQERDIIGVGRRHRACGASRDLGTRCDGTRAA